MTIRITIEAGPNEGKTALALLVADALMCAGLGVNVQDADVANVGQELASSLQPLRVRALVAKDAVVDVVTVQPRRRRVSCTCRRCGRRCRLDAAGVDRSVPFLCSGCDGAFTTWQNAGGPERTLEAFVAMGPRAYGER